MILIGEELVVNGSMSSAGEIKTRIEARSICLYLPNWCPMVLAASMFDGTEHGFKSVFYLRYRMPGPCVLLLFILVKPRNIASES